jgi:voltage-gated potassium channel Kch
MRVLKLYLSLFRAALAAILAPKVRALLLLCLLISALQAVVFRVIEGWPLIDSLYFSVVTMATVGYGDFVPQTVLGKLAAIAFMFIGIGVFFLTFSTLAQEFLRQATHGPDQPPKAGKETGEA